MKAVAKNFLIIFLLLFSLIASAGAATYYVDAAGGNDSSGNGTAGAPWRTIGGAQSAIAPGDTIYCSGNFGSVDFTGYKRGTDGHWIAYKAWPSMARPTIAYLAFERVPLNHRIEFNGFNFGRVSLYGGANGGASYLTFDGCDFVGAKVEGVFDTGYYAPYSLEDDSIIYARNDNSANYCTDITIRNCHFIYGHNAMSFVNYFKNVVIENNDIEEFADNGIEIRGESGERNFLIQNNNIHNGNCLHGPYIIYTNSSNIASNWRDYIGTEIFRNGTGDSATFYGYDNAFKAYIYYTREQAEMPARSSPAAWTLLNGSLFITPVLRYSVYGDNAHSDGISIEGAGINFNIYRNVMHDITGQGIKTGAGGPQNVRIIGNLFYNTGSHSAYFETGEIYFYNNTIDNPFLEEMDWGMRLFEPTAMTMFNNILSGGISESGSVSSNYNVWRNTPPSAYHEGANSQTLSPGSFSPASDALFSGLFVNRAARDYRLAAGSMAIGAGTSPNSILPPDMQSAAFGEDFAGNQWAAVPSAGAYEYAGAATQCAGTDASCGTYPNCPACGSGQKCCGNSCATPACTATSGCGTGQSCSNPGTCTASCQNIQCSEGAITSACYCQGTARTTGYCCSGAYQTTACTTPNYLVNIDFENGNNGSWTNYNPGNGTPTWTVTSDAAAGGTNVLALGGAINEASGQNILGAYRIINNATASNFTLEAKIRSTSQSDWGDSGIIFGYQNENSQYIAIFNKSCDPDTDGLFKVANGAKTKISTQACACETNCGTLQGNAYHDIKITKNGSGIQAYVDNMATPVFTATDNSYGTGSFGGGAINDPCLFDDLKITSHDTAECVDGTALSNYLAQWKAGGITMPTLMQKIAQWKAGAGC
jgi:hypothetical protein